MNADAQPVADAASQTGSPRLAVSASDDARTNEARPTAHLNERARTRLTHLLLGKSIVETLFVAALVVVFARQTFNPFFRGSLDNADAQAVAGWVVDASAPAARVEVQLFIDGHFAARGRADRERADVRSAGRAPDEFHGYNLQPPLLPPGEHEARIYAVQPSGAGRITLQQVDKPLRFVVPVSDENKAMPNAWWEATRP